MNGMSTHIKLSLGIIITGAVLLLFGLLLTFTGDPSSYFDIKDYDYTAQSADIRSVEIEIGCGDVNISTGAGFKLSARNAADELFEYSISNNVLRISYKTDIIESTYFSIGDGAQTSFDIVLPNKLLEEVSISLGSGTASVKGISCNELILTAGGGDISVDSVTVNQRTVIDAGSGDCKVSGCTIAHPEIKGGSGDLTVLKSRLTDMSYDGSFGSLNIKSCLLLGNSKLDTGFADATIYLLGGESSYGFSFDKGKGDITVEGSDYFDYDVTAAENIIYVKNGFGDVAISFGT